MPPQFKGVLELHMSLTIDDIVPHVQTVNFLAKLNQARVGFTWMQTSHLLCLTYCEKPNEILGLFTIAIKDREMQVNPFVQPLEKGNICISVHPEHRGQGIATRLFDEAKNNNIEINYEQQTWYEDGAKFITHYLLNKRIPFKIDYESVESFLDRHHPECLRNVVNNYDEVHFKLIQLANQGPHRVQDFYGGLNLKAIA